MAFHHAGMVARTHACETPERHRTRRHAICATPASPFESTAAMLAWAPALLTPYRVHGRAASSIRICTNGPSFVFSHASLQAQRVSGVYGGKMFPSKSARQLQRSWRAQTTRSGGSVSICPACAAAACIAVAL